MYIFKFIGTTISTLFRDIRRVFQTIFTGATDRRHQYRREANEVERLDRIRQPWKYLGK